MGRYNALFEALIEGEPLADALDAAGIDEKDQARLLPNMLAAASVLKYRSELARGFHATPEMLALFREVTGPIVEAMNDQESEMAELSDSVDRWTDAIKGLSATVTELITIVMQGKVAQGVRDEDEQPPPESGGKNLGPQVITLGDRIRLRNGGRPTPGE